MHRGIPLYTHILGKSKVHVYVHVGGGGGGGSDFPLLIYTQQEGRVVTEGTIILTRQYCHRNVNIAIETSNH